MLCLCFSDFPQHILLQRQNGWHQSQKSKNLFIKRHSDFMLLDKTVLVNYRLIHAGGNRIWVVTLLKKNFFVCLMLALDYPRRDYQKQKVSTSGDLEWNGKANFFKNECDNKQSRCVTYVRGGLGWGQLLNVCVCVCLSVCLRGVIKYLNKD